jgi:ABC-type polysaccharide/polyol phosphate export permease/Flp pilus assembly protein TadD
MISEESEILAAAAQAFEARPGNVNVIVDYAHHLLGAGETLRAIEVARRAATLAPGDFRTQRFLSSAYAVSGDLERAVAAAEQAVRIDPADPEVRVHLACLLVGVQRPRPAVTHLMAVTGGANETSFAWRLLSTALTELGRLDRALEAAARAIELAPSVVEYRIHRASVLASRGRHEEALEELSHALRLEPDDASVARARSGLLEALGEDEAALADAERAAALDPAQPELRAHLTRLQARAGLSADDAHLAGGMLEARAAWLTALPVSADRGEARRPTGFRTALQSSARIIYALMRRDMRSRFGRSRLGYFWAVMEPIGHLLTLGTVFAFLNHGRPLLGTDLYVFYVTGLIPFLMFSHVTAEIMPALTANVAVLSLPVVKQPDVVLAKALLGLWTDSLVALIVFGGFILLGRPGMPDDLLTCMAALLSMWLLALGFGLINMVVAEMFHTWEAVVSAALRLMYFLSGIYYSPLMMPAWIRDILVWNPVLQGVEWFRSGFFRQYSPHWLDVPYLLSWVVSCLVVGFAMQRVIGRRLVVFG